MNTHSTTSNEGWIEWNGGECPVHPDTLVDIKVIPSPGDERRVLFTRAAWANVWDSPTLVAYRPAQP